MNNVKLQKYMLFQMYGCVILFIQAGVLFNVNNVLIVVYKIALILGILCASCLSIYLIYMGSRGYKTLFSRYPKYVWIVDFASKIILFIVVIGSFGRLIGMFLPFN